LPRELKFLLRSSKNIEVQQKKLRFFQKVKSLAIKRYRFFQEAKVLPRKDKSFCLESKILANEKI
jgi:hypothetical protein